MGLFLRNGTRQKSFELGRSNYEVFSWPRVFSCLKMYKNENSRETPCAASARSAMPSQSTGEGANACPSLVRCCKSSQQCIRNTADRPYTRRYYVKFLCGVPRYFCDENRKNTREATPTCDETRLSRLFCRVLYGDGSTHPPA